MACLTLSLFLALSGLVATQGPDPIAQEWRVREAALAGVSQVVTVEPGEDWRNRFQALDVLNRRRPGSIEGSEVALAGQLLLDLQPNVRALALEVHAHHRIPVSASVEVLVLDSLPAVRVALARALAHGGPDAAAGWLAVLALDMDEEVAHEACAQLFAMGKAALEVQVNFLRENWTTLDGERFLRILDALDRSNESAALLGAMEALRLEAQGSGAEAAVRWALWGTLFDAVRDASSAEQLVQHWSTALQSSQPNTERMRRRRLEQLDGSAEYRALIVEGLLDRAHVLDQEAASEQMVWDARELVVDAVRLHFHGQTNQPFRSGSAVPEFPMRVQWSANLAEAAWTASFGRANAWTNAAGLGLFHTDDDVRLAAWDTLAEVWNRTGGLEPEVWLEAVMRDVELAPIIYRSFLRSERELPWTAQLHEWWNAQDPRVQLELLREHSSARVSVRWRGDLLERVNSAQGPSRVVLELLGQFRGDAEIAEQLRKAIDAQIAVLDASEVPDEDTTRGPWRSAEARASWLLEAWLGVLERDDRGAQERLLLLLRVGKLGKELGKRIVASLATFEPGQRALTTALGGTDLSSRLRYEVLLIHPDMSDRSSVDELYLAYGACDEELQLRILKRAQAFSTKLARALLLQVALDETEGPGARQAALDSLAGTLPRELAVKSVAQILADVEDYDLKQVALESLGAIALDHDALGLLKLYDDELERSLLGDELLATLVRVEVRAQGKLSLEVLERWRAKPGDTAERELRQRFRSKHLPGRNFAYAGWLAGAGELARANLLAAALGDGWWRWDGRLLMRLSEVLARDSEGQDALLVRRLQEGARIALLGEAPTSDREALLVRLDARLMSSALAAKDWASAGNEAGLLLAAW
ncbi:MAG: hypothetical protein ACI9F9_002405, partial [Candidatus Paceibacteria bacterium]